MQAATFVQVIEERQGLKIGCIEEIAYRMGFIDAEQLQKIATPLVKSGYGKYLMNLPHEKIFDRSWSPVTAAYLGFHRFTRKKSR